MATSTRPDVSFENDLHLVLPDVVVCPHVAKGATHVHQLLSFTIQEPLEGTLLIFTVYDSVTDYASTKAPHVVEHHLVLNREVQPHHDNGHLLHPCLSNTFDLKLLI